MVYTVTVLGFLSPYKEGSEQSFCCTEVPTLHNRAQHYLTNEVLSTHVSTHSLSQVHLKTCLPIQN